MTPFFQLFPKPLLTLDQLKLLKYDNLLSGNYKSNLDIGYNCKLKFEEEVEKYCYMWREAGQFSKKDLNVN
jgi:NADH dehydrogenase